MYNQNFVSYRSPHYTVPKRHQPLRFFVFALIVGFLTLGIYATLGLVHKAHAESLAKHKAAMQASFSSQLHGIFANYPDVTVSLAVDNLDTNDRLSFGSGQAVVAASTTKLVTALDFLHQVEVGTYSLNGSNNPDGNTNSWELEELINQSDDDSWTIFLNLLGRTQVQNYARQIGLSSFNVTGNTITPTDEATMLAELYRGQLLNKSDTELLLGYMQHTNDDSLIPAGLRASASVWHKYGELLEGTDNYVNDAAIIKNDGHTFVLTIYTDESNELDIQDRDTLIHQITQAVVQYEDQT